MADGATLKTGRGQPLSALASPRLAAGWREARGWVRWLRGHGAVARRYRGLLVGTQQPITVDLYGCSPQVVQAFIGGEMTVTELGRFHPLALAAARRRLGSDRADVVLTPLLPWQAVPPNACVVPHELDAVLTVAPAPAAGAPDVDPARARMADWLAGRKESLRRKIQQVVRLGFGIEAASSRVDYEAFANGMLRPMVQQRHGALAHHDTVDDLYRPAHPGDLRFIVRSGERLGGFIVRLPRVGLGSSVERLGYLDRIGMAPGVVADRALMNQVNLAIYHEAVRLSLAHGCSGLNFGTTPAILDHGLLGFKASLGADFRPRDRFARFRLECPTVLAGLIRRRHRPLIHFTPAGGLQASVCLTPEREADAEGLQVLKRGQFPSLQGIEFWRP